MPLRPVALALAAVLALAPACGSDDDSGSSATTSNSAPTNGTGGSAGDATLKIEVKDFRFSPNAIPLIAPGTKVTVNLTSTGSAQHTFTIAEPSVDVRLDAGGTGTASFTMPDTRGLAFKCSFHEGRGMTGVITTG